MKTIFEISLNDRGIFHWVAKPGEEIITPTGKITSLDVYFDNPKDRFVTFKLDRMPDGEVAVVAPHNAIVQVNGNCYVPHRRYIPQPEPPITPYYEAITACD